MGELCDTTVQKVINAKNTCIDQIYEDSSVGLVYNIDSGHYDTESTTEPLSPDTIIQIEFGDDSAEKLV